MPSRGQGLSQALRAPGEFQVHAVSPSGDCFYACLDEQLEREGRAPELADAGSMRDFVASRITQDMFEFYRIAAAAGADEVSWRDCLHCLHLRSYS